MIFIVAMFAFSFANAQDSSTKIVYKEVGTEKIYYGVVYYNKDRNGDVYLTEYKIKGIENGSDEFYNRKEYPLKNYHYDNPINGNKYKYTVPLGCCGKGYFNVD